MKWSYLQLKDAQFTAWSGLELRSRGKSCVVNNFTIHTDSTGSSWDWLCSTMCYHWLAFQNDYGSKGFFCWTKKIWWEQILICIFDSYITGSLHNQAKNLLSPSSCTMGMFISIFTACSKGTCNRILVNSAASVRAMRCYFGWDRKFNTRLWIPNFFHLCK